MRQRDYQPARYLSSLRVYYNRESWGAGVRTAPAASSICVDALMISSSLEWRSPSTKSHPTRQSHPRSLDGMTAKTKALRSERFKS